MLQIIAFRIEKSMLSLKGFSKIEEKQAFFVSAQAAQQMPKNIYQILNPQNISCL